MIKRHKKYTISIIMLLAVALMLGGCQKRFDPWPMFQNNAARSGATSAKAITQPYIQWRRYLGIQGYLNNPVIAGEFVCVGSTGTLHNAPDPMDGVYCMDRASGNVVWQQPTRIDATGIAYANGRLFAGDDNGMLRSYDSADGELIWKVQHNGELFSQPLLHSGYVIVGDSIGVIHAYQQSDGRRIWSTRVAGTPIRGGLAADDNNIYAAFREGKVAALDLSGKIVWSSNLSYPGFGRKSREPVEIYAAPTLYKNLVIITYARDTYYDDPAIYALNKSNGRVIWQASNQGNAGDAANIRSSVAVWDDRLLYGGSYSNQLFARNAKDGTHAWSVDVGTCTFPHWPSPAVSGNMLYLPRHDGTLNAIDLSTQKVAWQLYLGKQTMIGSQLPGNLLPQGWDCAWKPAIGEPLYASPAIAQDGTLYIGSGEGYLYAIRQAKVTDTIPKTSNFVNSTILRTFSLAYSHIKNDYIEEIDDGALFDYAVDGLLQDLPDSVKGVKREALLKYRPNSENDSTAFAKSIISVFDLLSSRSRKALDWDQFYNSLITGMIAGLDDQSEYYDRPALHALLHSYNTGAVGLELARENDRLLVVSVMPESPAQQYEIRSGDILTRIDEYSTQDMPLAKAIDRLRGDIGSNVTLTFKRDNQIQSPVTLLRKRIIYSGIEFHTPAPGIIHIKLLYFQKNSAQLIKEKLSTLPDTRGIILDLRNNSGGVLLHAINVADLFLDGGMIIAARGRNKDNDLIFNASKAASIMNAPLAILVNHRTAAGAEIVASAIKEHNRGIIIGSPTMGHGSIQTFYQLPNDTAFKLTSSYLYTASQNKIDNNGMIPDICVETDDTGAASSMECYKPVSAVPSNKLISVTDVALQLLSNEH